MYKYRQLVTLARLQTATENNSSGLVGNGEMKAGRLGIVLALLWKG